MTKKIVHIFIIGVFIYACALLIEACQVNNKPRYFYLSGEAIGTTYSIKYYSKTDVLTKTIDSIVNEVNNSFSTYIPNSDISKINKGDSTVVVNSLFVNLFNKSKRIYQETGGYFDPSVGILVNAWGFGPEKTTEKMDSLKIKELMKSVGFDKVSIHNNKIVKEDPNIYLDFNATAKGFLIDVISQYFDKREISDYLIEIGGEIKAKGINRKITRPWRIAVENPPILGVDTYATTMDLENKSMATSGNYRKFKINSQGKKYVHTVDPITGYTIENDILSATVIGSIDCSDADAYATAFMAMGYKKTLEFLEDFPKLKVFLIYVDSEGVVRNYNQ